MNKREKKSFNKAIKKAEKLTNPKQINQLLEQAEAKAKRHAKRIEKLWDDLVTMISLVKAWVRREYKGIPLKTIILMLAAIIYFVNPFDAIPDFLVAVGFIDDATILGFVLASLRNDLQLFRDWQKLKKPISST